MGKSAMALMYLARLHSVFGYFEASEFNFLLSKTEHFWVECDPMYFTGVKPFCDLEEAFFDGVSHSPETI